jgi:hypothetical protein
MRNPFGFLSLVCAALLTGCSGSIDVGNPSGSGGGGSSGHGGGGGHVPGSSVGAGGDVSVSSTSGAGGAGPAECSSPDLCPVVYFAPGCALGDPGCQSGVSSGAGGAGGLDPSTESAIKCSLQKLKDHDVGAVIVIDEQASITPCGTRTEIVSFGDGTVSVLPVNYCDIGVSVGAATRHALQSPAFFDKCLASNDKVELTDCIHNVTNIESLPGATCGCRGAKDGASDGACQNW